MAIQPIRFSLRVVFVVIAGVCWFLAYEANWIHARRHFIEEQGTKGARNEAMRAHWQGGSVNNVGLPAEDSYRQAPSCLEWFGERGYHHIAIVIPRADTATRRLGVGTDTLDTLSIQPDYVRAQRLFPEATIYPFVLAGSEAIEVNVKDAISGRVTTGQVYWGDDVWDDKMQQELDELRARLGDRR